MLKRVLLFSLFSLLLLACVVAFMAIKNPEWFTQHTTVQTFFQPNPSPTTIVQNSLAFSSLSPILIPEQINSVSVILDSQGLETNIPKLIQLEIAYDPHALLDVTIAPGNLYNNPTILLSNINQQTGRISYALTPSTDIELQSNLTNYVAVISFRPNPAFPGKQTTLSFLGKTMIRGKTDTNIDTKTQGIQLFFASNSAQPKQ